MELFGFCLTLEYGAINRSIYVCIILEINPPLKCLDNGLHLRWETWFSY